MQNSITATTAIFALLDSDPTVQDGPDAVVLNSSQGRIDFENVTFRYANTARDAISNLNLHIEPGKTYALVGASGSGKSVLLKLILGFWRPDAGRIFVHGRAIEQLQLVHRPLRRVPHLLSLELEGV